MATLYIVSAPSGCGKTSLIRQLLKQSDNLALSISYTTRAPRSTEISGIDYHFVEHNVFKRMIGQKAFLEYAKVLNHYYGTPLDWIITMLNRGMDVIVEIDWQGAQQIKEKYKETVSIFILPPSLESLRERLLKRGQDAKDTIEARLKQAPVEIAHGQAYDYFVINDDFQKALLDLQAIIRANRLRTNITNLKI